MTGRVLNVAACHAHMAVFYVDFSLEAIVQTHGMNIALKGLKRLHK